MPVINGVYLKDFTALPRAVADADIIPIAITGDNVAYRTTVAGIVTDARITAKLLTGLSVTGGAVIAADTILEAFGKVQNQINGKQGTVTLTTTGTSGASTLIANTLNIPQYQGTGNYITSLTGEATASGPGAAAVTLTNSAVIGKVLTGLNVTGGTVLAADSILDGFGKVQNQINGLIGGSIFQGTWNASTNTPTLVSSVGTNGYYYIVSVAGSTNLDGITDWKVGDWAIFAGAAWEKVDNTDSVSSVNGFTGAVSLTTDDIAEGATNLYFTNTRARTAISLTTTGTSGASTYDSGTGVFNIPTYADAYVGTVTSVAALTLGTTGTDLSSTVANSTTTPVITLQVPTASASNRGALSSADWSTFNGKQSTITLTTTGTSGAATLVGSTLNVPNYADGGVLSLSAIGGTANANAATITGTVLNLQPADASFGGVVTTGAQTFAGAKTLTGALAGTSATFSGNLGIGSPPTQAAQLDIFGGDEAALKTYSGFGNRSGSDLLINTYRLPGGDNYQRITDIVSLGDDVNGRESFIRFITTNTGASTATRLTIKGGEIIATVPLSGTSATFSGTTEPQVKITDGTNSLIELRSSANAASINFHRQQTGGTQANIGMSVPGSSGLVDDLVFAMNNGTSWSERMRITSAGNVGIGTTSPTAKLTIVKASHTSTLGASSVLQISDTSASGEAVGDRAEINFYTNSDSLGGNLQHATIGIIKTSTTGNETADLYFGTSSIGGSPVERMRITSGGNVGIGTTSPDAALTVKSIETAAKGISIWGRSDNIATLRFFNSTGATEQGGLISTSTYLGFIYADSEKMRITSGGNVGIGTTSPSEKLEVNGAIKTAAPSGGTAQPFKIGSVSAGDPTIVNELEVEINGVLYTIPCSIGTIP
jgi:hypothetical protein